MKQYEALTVLVVEDSASIRKIIVSVLNQIGFVRVDQAEDGKQALDIMAHTIPDLVISDINMPKVNGLELLSAMQKNPGLKTLPFVVLTSETSDETFKQVMSMGAADYIRKPFSKEDLIVKIKSIVQWLN